MTDPNRPDGFVDDDEAVPEDEAADWDEWTAEIDEAGEAFR